MNYIYKTISKTKISNNPYWDYYIDDYSLPNGNEFKYYYVHTPGSVFIIPRIKKDTFILTKQFRYLNNKESIEFPGGGQKKEFSHLQNALNELKEETGFIPKIITKIGEFNPFNGVTDEICSVYLADDLIKDAQHLDDTEQIEVIELSDMEINKLISSNIIWDGMTLAAWSLYQFSKES